MNMHNTRPTAKPEFPLWKECFRRLKRPLTGPTYLSGKVRETKVDKFIFKNHEGFLVEHRSGGQECTPFGTYPTLSAAIEARRKTAFVHAVSQAIYVGLRKHVLSDLGGIKKHVDCYTYSFEGSLLFTSSEFEYHNIMDIKQQCIDFKAVKERKLIPKKAKLKLKELRELDPKFNVDFADLLPAIHERLAMGKKERKAREKHHNDLARERTKAEIASFNRLADAYC